MLDFLENPQYPCLGPHLRLLGLTGLWHPIVNKKARCKLAMFYLTTAFFFSQYFKCIIYFNTKSLKLILQYIPFHMGIVKSCFFQRHHDRWSYLIEHTANIERSQRGHKNISHRVTDYIRRSRRITYFFWALAFFSNLSIFSEPYLKNETVNGTRLYLYIFEGYTPFSRIPPGYYCSMAVQTILGHLVSAYVVGWDTCVVSLMIFFAGQLKIFRVYTKEVINVKSKVESHKNIIKCHNFYLKLIEYHTLFNSLISPVMFIYLIVISVNLGVCIIQIVELKDDFGALLSACLYVLACLIQLLLFYWHSNEVTVESLLVSNSSFKTNWVDVDNGLRREVVLLAETTNRRLVFTAGPFHEMSISTFISILRRSYSFFTLLNETA
ncbi:unnamed protein product [Leptosia nina]|uniref:Odorant receptor n=1 Tax=Leptosia nina TaxID=320188 RepID=A0AAV1JX09_9NEOP